MNPKTERKNPRINTIYLYGIPKYKEVEIVAYLWNIDKKPFSVYKGEVEVLSLEN